MKKDLLYQPQIGYEKKYYTKGDFKSSNQEVVYDNDDKNIPSIVIEKLQNNIENNLKWIPDFIIDSYFSPFFVLKDEFNNLKDFKKNEQESDVVIIDNNNNNDDDFPDDMFSKGQDIYIDIKDPLAEKTKIINEKYIIDFLDIYKNYLKKLDASIQNHIYTTLIALGMSDKNQDLDSIATKDIINENLHHVSDYLTKSNISLNQNVRLHKKLFEIDATILHLRQIKIAKALIERYYKIEKLQNNNDLALTSNILLLESKRIADKKYKENFYSLYKYLNSNVILLNESINMLSKQNKSLLILNKYEKR